MYLMIVPIMDFINHSFDPNVVVLPHHDKLSNESYVTLKAVKDISKNEQLLMSYGNLSNNHLV